MNLVQIGTAVTLLALDGLPGPQTRFTSLVVNSSFDVIGCVAQNVGAQPVVVVAELYDEAVAIAASGEAEVAPGRTVEIADSAALSSGYCRFVFDADPATVRGYLRLRRATGETLALFPSFGVRPGQGGPSEAVTPPLRSISMADEMACVAQNLSDVTVDVDTDLLDENGVVIESSTDHLGAGAFFPTISSNAAHLGAYCHFSVSEHAGEVRGYALIFGASTGNAHLVFPAFASGGAGAAVAITPAVSSVTGDATACVAQNLDGVARMVDAELVDTAGTVLDDGSVMVQPGHVQTVAGHTEAGTSAVCRFTFVHPTDRVRGFITRFPSGLFKNTDLLALAEVSEGGAQPGTKTYGPPLGVGTDGYLQCDAVNLTNVPVSMHYEIDDGSGATVALADAIVPRRRGKSAFATQDLTDGFCTFASDGSPGDIRGYAALLDDSGLRTQQVFAAAPAGPSPTVTATPRDTFTGTATPSASITRTATATPTGTTTATIEPSHTAAPTGTAALPSATPATPTAQPTTPATGTCVGDCNDDGTVTVNELITLVTIGLGAPLASCPAGDGNGDGEVTIEELVTAVGNALDGCPAA